MQSLLQENPGLVTSGQSALKKLRSKATPNCEAVRFQPIILMPSFECVALEIKIDSVGMSAQYEAGERKNPKTYLELAYVDKLFYCLNQLSQQGNDLPLVCSIHESFATESFLALLQAFSYSTKLPLPRLILDIPGDNEQVFSSHSITTIKNMKHAGMGLCINTARADATLRILLNLFKPDYLKIRKPCSVDDAVEFKAGINDRHPALAETKIILEDLQLLSHWSSWKAFEHTLLQGDEVAKALELGNVMPWLEKWNRLIYVVRNN